MDVTPPTPPEDAPEDAQPESPEPASHDWQQQALAEARTEVDDSQPKTEADEQAQLEHLESKVPETAPPPHEPTEQHHEPLPALDPSEQAATQQASQPFVSGAVAGAVGAITGIGGGASPKKKLFLFGGATAVVLAVVVVLAISLTGGSNTVNQVADASKKTAAAAVDVDTLTSAALKLASITGYTKNTAASTATSTALTLNVNKQCALGFGTTTADTLPGATVEDIVNHQITLIKGQDATVDGPTAGPALVLHDASTSSKTYKLATLNFRMVKGENRLNTHYSVGVTGNGDRVVVTRVCYDTNNQDVPDSVLIPLEATARQITLTPGN